MKILWDNYLKDSTLSATSEDSLFPVENLTHRFLENKFQAEANLTTVTVLFPEDRTVSMIAYGFNNVSSSTDRIVVTKDATDRIVVTKGATDRIVISLQAKYVLKNAAGSTLLTGTLSTGEDVNVNYITATTCRSVEITFATADDTEVYVGGLSIGDPLEFDYIQINPRFNDLLRASTNLTAGGQLIGNSSPSLKEWQFTVPDMTNDERLAVREMIQEVGNHFPVYADLYDLSDIEPPMYCSITQAGQSRRDSTAQDYSMGMTLREAR